MSFGGWIFLLVSWGVILSLVGFCYFRTLRAKDENCDDETDPAQIS